MFDMLNLLIQNGIPTALVMYIAGIITGYWIKARIFPKIDKINVNCFANNHPVFNVNLLLNGAEVKKVLCPFLQNGRCKLEDRVCIYHTPFITHKTSPVITPKTNTKTIP